METLKNMQKRCPSHGARTLRDIGQPHPHLLVKHYSSGHSVLGLSGQWCSLIQKKRGRSVVES
jgi:hypothetical protein